MHDHRPDLPVITNLKRNEFNRGACRCRGRDWGRSMVLCGALALSLSVTIGTSVAATGNFISGGGSGGGGAYLNVANPPVLVNGFGNAGAAASGGNGGAGGNSATSLASIAGLGGTYGGAGGGGGGGFAELRAEVAD